MKAIDLLKKQPCGFNADGTTRYSSRNWRAFFIFLIAGGRTVVMNAHISGVVFCVGDGDLIVNTTFSSVEDQQ